jgi:hypothetical protein
MQSSGCSHRWPINQEAIQQLRCRFHDRLDVSTVLTRLAKRQLVASRLMTGQDIVTVSHLKHAVLLRDA